MRRHWVGGLIVLAIILVPGCTTGGGDQATAPADRPGKDPITQGALNAAANADAQLEDARNRLYEKCMSAKGFTVHPQHSPADPAQYTVKEPPIPRPENAADARQFGYRISDGPPVKPAVKTVPHDPFADQPQEARDRYSEALTGPGNPSRSEQTRSGDKERDIYVMPDGSKKFVYRQGCEPDVDRSVLGDVKRYIELRYAGSSGLDKAVFEAAQGDPAVSAARTAWAGCMSGKGYPGMQDPVDAAKKAEFYYQNVDQSNPDAVRQAKGKEVTQAVAHTYCSEQTKVEEMLQTAWRREYAAYLTAHEADLVAWQEFAKGALTRAQQMLAG